jgi:ferric-dicitrate binding protein FerR (iron transport regulator)
VDASAASEKETEKIELLPGDKGVFVKATAIITKEQEQAKNSTAWKDGLLDFAGVPLGEVVKVIARYYDVNIELSNPGLERCLFYGTYDHPSLEDLLRAIEFSSELKLEENNGIYRFSGEGCE